MLEIAFLFLALLLIGLAASGLWLLGWGVWYLLDRALAGRPAQAVSRWWRLVVDALRAARSRSGS